MWTGRLGTWWSSLRTTRMSSSRFLRKTHSIHLPRKFLTFSLFSAFPRIAKWSTSSSVGTSSSRWEARRATSSWIRSSSTSSLGDGLEQYLRHHHQLELLDQLFHRLTGGWASPSSTICLLDHLVPLIIVGRLDHLCNFAFLDKS